MAENTIDDMFHEQDEARRLSPDYHAALRALLSSGKTLDLGWKSTGRGYDRAILSPSDLKLAIEEMNTELEQLSHNGSFIQQSNKTKHNTIAERYLAYTLAVRDSQ